MPIELARMLITVEVYQKMIEAGILTENDRVELINGEILEMSPIGSEHSACVKRINAIFANYLHGKVIVGIQDPITIMPNSEPEPDISILKHKANFYSDGHPTPEDVLIIIEVADTTLAFDRKIKLPMYANGGIREYWIVNLEAKEIEVYKNPMKDNYKKKELFRSGEKIHLEGLVVELKVTDLLG